MALARVGPKRLERTLARLDARSRVVLRRRLLAEDPMTLEALGRKLSLTRERVRQIELAAIVALTRALHGEPRRAANRRRAGSRGAEEKRRARGRRTARRSGAT